MSKKSSIYFGLPLMELTADLSDSDSVSGRINRMAERYAVIIKRHAIELTEGEAFVLADCLNGTWAEPLLIRHLADEVADSGHADSSDAKSLIKKLESASFADLVATVESLGF